MSAPGPSNSILVLHHQYSDPSGFLQRLTGDPDVTINPESTGEDEAASPIWHIDNKYYTADVSLVTAELPSREGSGSGGEDAVGYPVILYLFTDRPPDPLPPLLTRIITSEPRDVALAIRIRSEKGIGASLSSAHADPDASPDEQEEEGLGSPAEGDEWERIEEAFLELGMEVVDELQTDEESLDPIEEARMTIMTHLWPNMVRKPLGTRTAVDLDLDLDELSDEEGAQDGEGGSGESDYGDDGVTDRADFAVKFSSPAVQGPAAGAAPDTPSPGSEVWSEPDPEGRGAEAGPSAFPSLVTLTQQLADTSRLFAQLKVERDLAEARRMDRLDQLERELQMDSDEDEEEPRGGGSGVGDGEGDAEIRFGRSPGRGEWARLDDWLDDDGDGEGGADGEEGYEILDQDYDLGGGPDKDGTDIVPPVSPFPPGSSGPSGASYDPHGGLGGDEAAGFDDDFADFQGGPEPTSSAGQRRTMGRNGRGPELPMDPTPLLLHLQSVRAELAGVPDEDERRVRAAREVMAILGIKAEQGLEEGWEDGG